MRFAAGTGNKNQSSIAARPCIGQHLLRRKDVPFRRIKFIERLIETKPGILLDSLFDADPVARIDLSCAKAPGAEHNTRGAEGIDAGALPERERAVVLQKNHTLPRRLQHKFIVPPELYLRARKRLQRKGKRLNGLAVHVKCAAIDDMVFPIVLPEIPPHMDRNDLPEHGVGRFDQRRFRLFSVDLDHAAAGRIDEFCTAETVASGIGERDHAEFCIHVVDVVFLIGNECDLALYLSLFPRHQFKCCVFHLSSSHPLKRSIAYRVLEAQIRTSCLVALPLLRAFSRSS